MRRKEDSDDYRYFPEPDLPPLHLDAAWLDEIRSHLPELPAARRARYRDRLGLSAYQAAVIVNDEAMTAAFEAVRAAGPDLPATEIANFVTGEYGRLLKETPGRTAAGLAGRAEAASLAAVLHEVLAGRLSRANAREVVAEHVAAGAPATAIIAARDLARISDADELGPLVDGVLAANPAAVADLRAGRAQAAGFLVGQVMKASRGQADAATVRRIIDERLVASGGGAGEGGRR
jgi:aspartyl-tRNA(Asn)/glutamyl-tRNA(Gln) amidotransferase subunit B